MLPPFISAAALARHLGQVVVCDVRHYLDGRSGRAAYDARAHPDRGARSRSTATSPRPPQRRGGRHPLPDAEGVRRGDGRGGHRRRRRRGRLRRRGRRDGGAARLDAAGHRPRRRGARRRDPGLDRPAADARAPPPDRPVRRARLAGAPARRDRRGRRDRRRAARRRARPSASRARPHELDPRPGHIPGARGLPTREHVGEDGTLRPRDELRRRFAAVGVQRGTRVVSYCGSGVAACHQLLVLEHAGLGPGRLYPGSWSQWAGDPARPAETGA